MSNMISVNFEGVEAGMNFAHIPEGDYGFKVTKVQSKEGQDSGKPYLLFYLKVTTGNSKGINKVIPHTCSLTKNALWNLRNLLEAAGKTIPPKAIKIDLDKLIGLTLAGAVTDDEYNGKKKSVVSSFFPMSELSTEAEKKKEDDSEEVEASPAGDVAGDSSTDEEEELFD